MYWGCISLFLSVYDGIIFCFDSLASAYDTLHYGFSDHF